MPEIIFIVDISSSKLDLNLLIISNKNSIKIKNSDVNSSLGDDIFNKDLFNKEI